MAVAFANFELFIAHHGIKKPQSTRILVRAAEAVRQYGPQIAGGLAGWILGDPALVRLFWYDFHQGDSEVMLAHWNATFASFQGGDDEVYIGQIDADSIDLIVDPSPPT
jgi:hypothetical protein